MQREVNLFFHVIYHVQTVRSAANGSEIIRPEQQNKEMLSKQKEGQWNKAKRFASDAVWACAHCLHHAVTNYIGYVILNLQIESTY